MIDQVTTLTIDQAAERLKDVAKLTPLDLNKRLSAKYNANVYIKREDLQEVRSFKIRGANNLMSSLTDDEKKRGVVCASAGNHAQGVAASASALKIKATIFMPAVTPLQKIDRVKHFGDGWVDVQIIGQNFDECAAAARKFCSEINAVFVHPFDDWRTISGQGTIGKEILEQLEGQTVDYVLCPIGGGGLISGVSTYIKEKQPNAHVIGVEPMGAASMGAAFKANKVVSLETIDTFVEGTAVKTVGDLPFAIASKYVKQILFVEEGKVSLSMIELYQNEGIVAEPAGALTMAALDQIADQIKGKTVVCVLSGGNNDILRYPEVLEKSLVYQGLKHYFLLEFAQKPGQLKHFLNEVLGPSDDIVRFEYMKKTSKERGPALIGIELTKKEDLEGILRRMEDAQIRYTILTSDDPLYSYLI